MMSYQWIASMNYINGHEKINNVKFLNENNVSNEKTK
jgi:hypothetical protein